MDHLSYKWHVLEVASGGGATHIALNSNRGELVNYASYISEILIIVGGDGGSFYNDEPEENAGDDNIFSLAGGAGGGTSTNGVFATGSYGGGGGYNGGSEGWYHTGASGGGSNYTGGVINSESKSGIKTGNGKAIITLIQ